MKKKTKISMIVLCFIIIGSLFAKGNKVPLESDNKKFETVEDTFESGLSKNNVKCKHEVNSFNCVKYVRNYDADTITVDIPYVHPFIGEKIGVRVYGVDAPELTSKNACEKEVARNGKKLVERLLKNAKRIDLKNIKKDKYFRILADVEFDGQDLRKVLLKNKLAYEYFGGTKLVKDWCNLKTEKIAE